MTASTPSAARAAVDQLEGLLAGATELPWEHVVDHHQRDIQEHSVWSDGADGYVVETLVARRAEDDAALIVAAVNALPHLLAAVKAVDELRAYLADQAEQNEESASVSRGGSLHRERHLALRDGYSDAAARIRAALALAAVDVTETAE